MLQKKIGQKTYKRTGDGDVRCSTVANLPPGEDSEEEKAQQRSVSVGSQFVNQVHYGIVTEYKKYYEQDEEYQAHKGVDAFAFLLVSIVQEIHAERGGK